MRSPNSMIYTRRTPCCRERRPSASTVPRQKGSNPGSSPAKSRASSTKNSMRQGVFSRITRFDPNPDIILSGRITAFHEHYRPQTWAKIPGFIPYVGTIAQVFRLKTHVSSGEAKVTLFVLKSTGELFGSYTGQSIFKETFNPTKEVPPGARLNRALSEAIHQIQDEISHDVQLRELGSR